MASMQTALASIVCKNVSNSAFLPGFHLTGHVAGLRRKDISPNSFSGPRATLTFDPPTDSNAKSKQRKHTVDPNAPDFLPLPSFEECFPKSSKEHKYSLSFILFLFPS